MGRRRTNRRPKPAPQRPASAEPRATLTRRGGDLYLGGELTFATAAGLLRELPPLFADGEALLLDLQGVTRGDSAGLALLLEWVEEGRKRGVDLRYRNVPEALINIARFSNVLELLPLEA